MKPTAFVAAFLIALSTFAQAAPQAPSSFSGNSKPAQAKPQRQTKPQTKPTFEAQATNAAVQAVFQRIVHYYKNETSDHGDLIPSEEHPVVIAFSAPDKPDKDVKDDNNDLEVVYEEDDIYVAGEVQIRADVELNSGANTDGSETPVLSVKSGKYEVSGSFLVNEKPVSISAGEAQISGIDAKATFSDGAKAAVDGKDFTFKDGSWHAGN